MNLKIVISLFIANCLCLNPTYAACTKKLDPAKVILFLNVNGSYGELDGAIAAACERGETLVIVPDSLPSEKTRQALAAAAGKARDFEDILLKCNGMLPSDPAKKIPAEVCKTIGDKSDVATAAYTKLLKDNSIQPISQALVDAKLKDLAAKNKAIRSIVISGHDGGGEFANDSGAAIKGLDLAKSLQSAYQGKPALLSELQSMLLWGCYTATPEQVTFWKQNIPSLREIAGFNNIAPASVRLASKVIMQDVLVKQDLAISAKNSIALKAILKSIKDFNLTSFGAYVQTCGGDGLYMGNELRDDHDIKKGFVPTFLTDQQLAECNDIKPDELKRLQNELEAYSSGAKPIPTDTSSGDLRTIYSFSRKHEKCIPGGANMNGDHVGLLLFFNDVKMNFAATEKALSDKIDEQLSHPDILAAQMAERAASERADDIRHTQKYIDEAGAECNKTSLSESDRKLWCDSLKDLQDKLHVLQEGLGKDTKAQDISDMKYYIDFMKKSYWSPTMENMKTKSREDIANEANFLASLQMVLKWPELDQLANGFQRSLYNLSPDCMDFLDWHEFRPNRPPPQFKCSMDQSI